MRFLKLPSTSTISRDRHRYKDWYVVSMVSPGCLWVERAPGLILLFYYLLWWPGECHVTTLPGGGGEICDEERRSRAGPGAVSCAVTHTEQSREERLVTHHHNHFRTRITSCNIYKRARGEHLDFQCLNVTCRQLFVISVEEHIVFNANYQRYIYILCPRHDKYCINPIRRIYGRTLYLFVTTDGSISRYLWHDPVIPPIPQNIVTFVWRLQWVTVWQLSRPVIRVCSAAVRSGPAVSCHVQPDRGPQPGPRPRGRQEAAGGRGRGLGPEDRGRE